MTAGHDPAQLLASIRDVVDWPEPSPHLAPRVLTRIQSAHEPPASVRRRLVAVLAILAVVTGLTVLSPTTRHAIADLIVQAGVRIGFVDEKPVPGAGLVLGTQIDVEDAAAQAEFTLRVPTGELGEPDVVYMDEGRISMVWRGSEDLPAAGTTDVAVVLTQSVADVDPFAVKGLTSETEIQFVSVEGDPGIWVEGAPHTVTLLDPQGDPIEITTRLAANVLLWERGGVGHRLETTADLARALSIAGSLERAE